MVTGKWINRTRWFSLLAGGFLLLGTSPGSLYAQEVAFRASASPGVVGVGERFRVSFSVNAQAENFRAPDFSPFLVLSGPNMSTSSSVQVINGKMSQSVSYTYNYVLEATKEGTFTIGSASIDVKRKTYQSQEVSVEVVKGSTQPQSTAPSPTPSSDLPGVTGEDLFVKVFVDKKEVYQGEPLVATIKLFSRVDLTGLGKRTFPNFSGFLQQDIELPEQNYLNREAVNGQIYGTLVLRQLVLIPQRSGTLTIDPMEIECMIRQRQSRGGGDIFDRFFDSFQTVSRTVKSDPIEVRVKPLPAGAPASFRGLVGSYKLESSLDRDQVSVNDAVTLRLVARGSGNLRLMEAPAVNFPPDFESYDPKVTTDVHQSTAGSSGSKSFEYLILPRSAGKFRIPSFEVSYFDPSSKSYKQWKSPEYTINVAPGEPGESGTVVSGFGKEELQYLGKDIRFIKTGNISLKASGSYILEKTWYYLAFPLILVGFILFVIYRGRRAELKRNTELMRNRKANKMARKRLKRAYLALQKKDREGFYEEVTRACWGYLSDKLNIPLSSLNRTLAREELSRHGISQEMTDQYFTIVDRCEMARYSGSAEEDDMHELYRSAMKQITGLDANLK